MNYLCFWLFSVCFIYPLYNAGVSSNLQSNQVDMVAKSFDGMKKVQYLAPEMRKSGNIVEDATVTLGPQYLWYWNKDT